MSTPIQTLTEAFREFDPNAPSRLPWSTYAQRRSVKFKMHKTRAAALTTYAQYGDLTGVYNWDSAQGRWAEIATKDLAAQEEVCTLCGKSTRMTGDEWLQITYPQYFAVGRPHNHFMDWEFRRRPEDTQFRRDYGSYRWMRRSGKIVYPLQQHFMCPHCQQRFS